MRRILDERRGRVFQVELRPVAEHLRPEGCRQQQEPDYDGKYPWNHKVGHLGRHAAGHHGRYGNQNGQHEPERAIVVAMAAATVNVTTILFTTNLLAF